MCVYRRLQSRWALPQFSQGLGQSAGKVATRTSWLLSSYLHGESERPSLSGKQVSKACRAGSAFFGPIFEANRSPRSVCFDSAL
jgi:hypothetical protein